MPFEKRSYKLTGLYPTIMNNGQMADPLNPYAIELAKLTGKRKKTVEQHMAIAEAEMRGKLYLNDEGHIFWPNENIERCVRDAAKFKKLGKAVQHSLQVVGVSALEYDWRPKKLTFDDLVEAIVADPRFAIRTVMKNQSSRVVRVRPIFQNWSLECSIVFDDATFDAHQVDAMFKDAAAYIGLSDSRPRYGKFRAEVING